MHWNGGLSIGLLPTEDDRLVLAVGRCPLAVGRGHGAESGQAHGAPRAASARRIPCCGNQAELTFTPRWCPGSKQLSPILVDRIQHQT